MECHVFCVTGFRDDRRHLTAGLAKLLIVRSIDARDVRQLRELAHERLSRSGSLGVNRYHVPALDQFASLRRGRPVPEQVAWIESYFGMLSRCSSLCRRAVAAALYPQLALNRLDRTADLIHYCNELSP